MSKPLIWVHRISAWLSRCRERLLPADDATASTPPFDLIAQAAALSRASYLGFVGFTRALDGLMSVIPETVSFIDDEQCQAYVWVSGDAAFLVFRGTDDALDMLANVHTRQERFLEGKVHSGFLCRYSVVKDKIKHFLDSHAGAFTTLLVTGHSMGGALASLAAIDLANTVRVTCVTFGSPRVGNGRFSTMFGDKLGERHWRVFHELDPVPMVPMDPFYTHLAGNALRVRPTGEWVVQSRDVAWFRRFPLALLSLDMAAPLKAHGTASYVAYAMLLALKIKPVRPVATEV
jgi:hypothetical protein